MKKVTIDKIPNFEELVNSMELNVKYELPETSRFAWIQIEEGKEFFSKETYFTWSMEYNYKVASCVGYIYPDGGKNTFKTFKTPMGAKRNFIKAYKSYFENRFK